jgi:hypothetical protein
LAEWIYEAGIGERRAALIDGGSIIAARIERDSDGVRAGTVAEARWLGGHERLARLDSGEDLYVARGISNAPEGSRVRVVILREAIREASHVKRAVAACTDLPVAVGTDLLTRIGGNPKLLHAHEPDALDDAGWHDVIDQATTGIVPFTGGLLRLSLTPAMLVVDVDGDASGLVLAHASIDALVATIRRLDLAGNIVVDLPALANATERKAVGERFDAAMASAGIRFERTAMNGFGLLQIIIPRERPNLLERLQLAPIESAALALLRQAERTAGSGTGMLTLTAQPAVIGWLEGRSPLIADLGRRTGRNIQLQADPNRCISASHAQ